MMDSSSNARQAWKCLDHAEVMLDRTKRHADGYGVPECRFIPGHAAAMPTLQLTMAS